MSIFAKPAVLTTVEPQVRAAPDERALKRLAKLDSEIERAEELRVLLAAEQDQALAAVIASDEGAKKNLENAEVCLSRASGIVATYEAGLKTALALFGKYSELQKLAAENSQRTAALRQEAEAVHANPKIESLRKREENLRYRRDIHMARHGLSAPSTGEG